jgi:hypothetical protein
MVALQSANVLPRIMCDIIIPFITPILSRIIKYNMLSLAYFICHAFIGPRPFPLWFEIDT